MRVDKTSGIQTGIGQGRAALLLKSKLSLHLLAASALVAVASFATSPVWAQAAGAGQQVQRISFDIAAQPLSKALVQYSNNTGVQLFYDANIVRGKNSSGAKGSLTRSEALNSILSGSGLSYRIRGNTVTISTQQAGDAGAVAADGSLLLDTITLQGAVAGDTSGSVVVENSRGATKTDTPLIEVPQSVSVVSRKQIETQNAQSVTEILRYVPGVTIETYGPDPKGYDWILMRGFNAQSTSSYQDGLRQLSNSYTFFRTDPYELDSIEVLRGPVSSLYGQSDAGGLVNRVTKKPQAEAFHEASVEYGSYNRKQFGVDLTGPVNEDKTLLYRMIGVVRKSDTQFEYSNGDEVKDDRYMFAPSLTWAPDADTSLTVSGQLLRDDSGGSVLPATISNLYPNSPNILVGDPDFNRSVQKQGSIGYEFEHHLNDTWTLKQNLRYGQVSFLLDNVLALGLGPTGITRQARRFDENMSGFVVDNQAVAEFETGNIAHEALFGLDYSYSDSDVSQYRDPAPSLNPFNPSYGIPIAVPTTLTQSYRQKYNQTGIYAQDQIKFNDSWIVTLGGRYDWLNLDNHNRLDDSDTDQNIGKFSGRAGITYVTPWGIAPYVSYSESFVPNLGTDNSGNTFDPSEGRQWEAGVKYQPKEFDGLFTMAWFDIVKSNVVSYSYIDGPQATGEVHSRGLELEGKVNLSYGWDFIGSYTYTHTEITEDAAAYIGKQSTMVPEHQASAWLNYTFNSGALEGLSLGSGVRYVGSSYGDKANTVKVDGRTLVDAGVSYKYKDMTFQLNATNLFDKKYFTTCEDAVSCYEGDRRSVIGRVKVSF
ncbi:iron complex outermembrane receptor protein [Ochrobactrum sp. 19YEA23]|uniref:TonB-dependent siderophore receptor n=1 Tax=Ochrobactrum sp. 19YEA23 TaxID=3039854 RepID=UPI002479451B|nr:iron complex outermembrane receptor protein [Ochrobactrum sp. 19YEA23]